MTENSKQSLRSPALQSPTRPSKILKTQHLRQEEQDEEEDEQLQQSSAVAEPMNPNARIQRYLIAIEYIGTRFAGSQKQLTCRTVVGVLEEAFHKFIGRPVSISLSSRTDAGVHALSNVCHVDVERISKRKPGEVLTPHEPSVVRNAVNHFLQKNEGDMKVIDVRCVPSDFHARFRAQERTYFYRLLSGPDPLSTFEKDRAWHVPEDLDLLAMQDACKVLVGHHDFSSFRGSGCQAKSPIRTLDELSVAEVPSTPYFPSVSERKQYGTANPVTNGMDVSFGTRKTHRCFVITARARAFLYHQVRLLVGILKCVGTGNLTSADVKRILEAKSVSEASAMAPACGLYLGHVKYEIPSMTTDNGSVQDP